MSVALSLIGGVLGLAVAAVVLRVVPALVPGDVARLKEVGIGPVTVAFTVGLSVFVGLLSGAAPALQWSGIHLTRTPNEGNAQSAGGFRLSRSNRSRAVLVMAQVALALVLLVGTGLLLRSFVGLLDRGYDPGNVVSAEAVYPRTSQPSLAPGPGRRGLRRLASSSRRERVGTKLPDQAKGADPRHFDNSSPAGHVVETTSPPGAGQRSLRRRWS